MKLTSKISLSSLNKNLDALLPEIKKDFARAIAKTIVREIKGSIEAGISPVAGEGRFVKYSASYANSIKKGRVGHGKNVRPVNLKVTGDMLKTLKARMAGDKCRVVISHKLANIHNTLGAGKSKIIRRIMPDGKGEIFSRALMSYLKEAAMNAVKRVINKRFPKV